MNAEELLKALPSLNSVQLREEWFLRFYTEASGAMSDKLLRLAIAHRIQELECDTSGTYAAIKKKALLAAEKSKDDEYGHAQHTRPGTRFLREYNGKIHEVQAVDHGRFVYEGIVFKSLSAVAMKITGVTKSGTNFFGLTGKIRRGIDRRG